MRTPPLSPALASLNLPLPRPPAWIWLFTTQIGPGSVFAAASESADCSTGTPFEIGTPNSCSSDLAWYSWMFIWTFPEPSCGEVWNSHQFCGWHTIYHRPIQIACEPPEKELQNQSEISHLADLARFSCRHRPDPAPRRPTC